MIAYRIADARHPVFDPTGAMIVHWDARLFPRLSRPQEE